MPEEQPGIEDWKNLFDAAIKFKEVDCWDWMWDSDLFGIQNPKNGEIGYCCVMGKNREHFALGVYLGTEGLEGLNKVQDRDVVKENSDLLHFQNCLMASFEDRSDLREKDFEISRKLPLEGSDSGFYLM